MKATLCHGGGPDAPAVECIVAHSKGFVAGWSNGCVSLWEKSGEDTFRRLRDLQVRAAPAPVPHFPLRRQLCRLACPAHLISDIATAPLSLHTPAHSAAPLHSQIYSSALSCAPRSFPCQIESNVLGATVRSLAVSPAEDSILIATDQCQLYHCPLSKDDAVKGDDPKLALVFQVTGTLTLSHHSNEPRTVAIPLSAPPRCRACRLPTLPHARPGSPSHAELPLLDRELARLVHPEAPHRHRLV